MFVSYLKECGETERIGILGFGGEFWVVYYAFWVVDAGRLYVISHFLLAPSPLLCTKAFSGRSLPLDAEEVCYG